MHFLLFCSALDLGSLFFRERKNKNKTPGGPHLRWPKASPGPPPGFGFSCPGVTARRCPALIRSPWACAAFPVPCGGPAGGLSLHPASGGCDCSPAPPLPLLGLSPPPPLAAIHPAACPSLWAWPMSGTRMATTSPSAPPPSPGGRCASALQRARKATERGHHELPGVS